MTSRAWAFLSLAILIGGGCAGSKSRLRLGATEGGEVVEAEGMAPYNSEDLLATKKASLTDAQRKAVEKAVGVYVSARTFVEKAVAIESNILAETEGYIKKYDILEEKQVGEFYTTKIRALVAMKNLEEDLRELSLLNTKELKRPRVTIDIAESVNKKRIDENPAATAFQNMLIEQGFVVLDSESKDQAELVISGKASAYPFQSDNLGGFVSYRARLSINVARPGTKNNLLSLSKEASGLGGNPTLAGLKALETVGELAGREASEKLAEKLIKNTNIYLYVENVADFSAVERIKKMLISQPGIGDVVLRLYEARRAEFEATLDRISPSELASRLEASQSLRLKVLESRPQNIRLKLDD